MFAGLVWLCCAQAVVPDARLARIRQHMAQILSSMPNYTCEQTVERSRQAAGERRLRVVDTLRIEVSFVEGKELFAWPGADKFGEVRLEDMVTGQAAVGTGAFAMHADFIFRSSGPAFRFSGEEVKDGRKLLRYDFNVPQKASRFEIRSGGNGARVAYHGSFAVDAETLDLVNLRADAEEIPPFVGVTSSGSSVEYARRPIGDSRFLLPASSEMRIVDRYGNRNVNRTTFGACRQYAGTSTITFAEPGSISAQPERPVQGAELPRGLNLELSLVDAVELTHAAIGDPVSATLTRDVKKNGVVLLPKGARFRGRVTRVERREARRIGDYAICGLRFDSITNGNVRSDFHGNLEEVTYAAQRFYVPFANSIRRDSGWNAVSGQRVLPPAEGEGVFLTRGPLRLPAGMRMLWRTRP